MLAGDLVQVAHFDTWDGGVIPSTDVAGLTYHGPSGQLYLADSEINEISEIFDGNNLFAVSPDGGTLHASFVSGNSEPTGIVYNPFDGYFYVTNDNRETVTRYDSTFESVLAQVNVSDDLPSAIDPEGITVDPATGLLYVADGLSGGQQILVYNSDLEYQSAFSVADRIADPEGITFDPTTGHLLIVSSPDLAVFEYTTTGGYVATYDISGFSPRPISPQGLAIGPTSNPNDDAGALALYIADAMEDNVPDGRIYEAVFATAGNQGPVVDAGENLNVFAGESVALQGTVMDDGLPDPPASVTTLWTLVSGPGSVDFVNAAATNTTATFSLPGTYVLRLAADDGELVIGDNLTVTVLSQAGSHTFDFQDGVNGYSGTRDAGIDVETDDENLGSDPILRADGGPDRAALFRWDTSAIPRTSVVSAASITLEVTNGSDVSYEFYRLLRDWTENGVTWNDAENGVAWQTAGAQGASDRGSDPIGQIIQNSENQVTIELNAAGVAAVQAWVENPAANFGVILQDYTEGTDGVAIESREISDISNRPRLSIEFSAGGVVVNQPPVVNAGANQTITLSQTASLNGTAIDDGLPNPPANLTTQWSKVSGPGTVSFGNAGALATGATFSLPGTYVLRLGASDSELSNSDTVTVVVLEDEPVIENEAPVVQAGADQTVLLSEIVALDGTVTDDGLPNPPASVTTTWTKQSGPGSVTFANSTAIDTTATFTEPGTYVLRLTAHDGELSQQDDVTVTVTDNSGEVTVAFRHGVDGYTGAIDARIEASSADTNYGSNSLIKIDGNPDRAGLFQWDISSIPAGSFVTGASITFDVTNSSGVTYDLYQLLRAWDEGTVTWNEAIDGAAWQTAGVQGSSDRGNDILGQLRATSLGHHTIDLNAAGLAVVQSWIDNPASNYGFILQDYFEGSNGLVVSSREVSNVNDRPQLELTYFTDGSIPNRPPTVNAGTDQSVFLGDPVALNGTVTDDGLPEPANVTTRWSRVSGPGTVNFANASVVDATATFSAPGNYVLRLTANDGELMASDEVSVTVQDGSAPITVNFQQGANGYSGAIDARLESEAPGTNYGSATVLRSDGNPDRSSLFKWDTSTIPAGSVITEASITLQVINRSRVAYEFYELLRDWDENQVNWNQAAQGDAWETAGAQGSSDRASTALGVIESSSTGQFTVELNAAGLAAVQRWVNNPASNFGVILQDYIEGGDGLAFYSREASAVSERPRLQVTYTAGGPVVNQAPQVNAGLNQTTSTSEPVFLNATVTDDGLPSPPGAVTTSWTQVSGPGTVAFANAAAIDTLATFSAEGTYVLRLTADDGEHVVSDDVTIIVDNTPVPTTVDFQQGVNGYFGASDTRLETEFEDENFGSASLIKSDGGPDRAGLFRWDISSIPAGRQVTEASITLEVVNGSTVEYELYQLLRAWSEDDATWNDATSGAGWQTPGAQGTTDRTTTPIGSIDQDSTGSVTIELNAVGIAMVQAWVDNPAANHGVILQDYDEGGDGLAISSNEASSTGDRPRLQVTYL